MSKMLVHGRPDPDGKCRYCARTSCRGTHVTFAGDTLYREVDAARRAGDLSELAELQRSVRELTDDSPSSVVAAAAAPTTPGVAAADAPALELVDQPELVVRIHAGALSRIDREIYSTTRVDGLEAGGLLYASVHGDALEIEAASGVGDEAERTEVSIAHDARYQSAFDRELAGSDLHPVGRWHTHPYFAGNDVNWRSPSSADRRGMARFVEFIEDVGAWPTAASVELILTAPDYAKGSWEDPHISAFVAQRDPITHRITVQNARVLEED